MVYLAALEIGFDPYDQIWLGMFQDSSLHFLRIGVSDWVQLPQTLPLLLRISSTSTNGADYSSKEGANPPQLIITLAGTPTPAATATATNTNTPTSTAMPTPNVTATVIPSPTGTSIPSGPVTINYTYDPLYRLTEANYSTGDYYHYTYDAVGNRLTQETLIGSVPLTTSYLYDNANRLTNVNGVPYTWDNNGNLLNDGVNTYTHDSANRLTSLSGGQSAAYAYNGLGDRLSQNGVNYTLDLNAGLTQVLNDGTNQYLYGLGRIAQVNTTTEYYLSDALGSVRQLTDANGDITLANAYDPYGSLAQTAGSAQTSYGFTGEYTDPSGMVYLRARYYLPGDGRFLTRDTWMGDTNSPLSLNRWMYWRGIRSTLQIQADILQLVIMEIGIAVASLTGGSADHIYMLKDTGILK